MKKDSHFKANSGTMLRTAKPGFGSNSFKAPDSAKREAFNPETGESKDDFRFTQNVFEDNRLESPANYYSDENSDEDI